LIWTPKGIGALQTTIPLGSAARHKSALRVCFFFIPFLVGIVDARTQCVRQYRLFGTLAAKP
jgi:hypothetical protein